MCNLDGCVDIQQAKQGGGRGSKEDGHEAWQESGPALACFWDQAGLGLLRNADPRSACGVKPEHFDEKQET